MASWLYSGNIQFEALDVYNIAERFSGNEPFDVTLALGGLYHVPDPPYVLYQLREVTSRYLIIQTSSILPGPLNGTRFVLRGDRTHQGLPSIRGGRGVWKYSVLASARCWGTQGSSNHRATASVAVPPSLSVVGGCCPSSLSPRVVSVSQRDDAEQ